MSALEAEALWLSLIVAGRAALVGLPLAIVAAWIVARCRFPGRTLIDALLHAPLVLPPVVVGFALLLLFGVQGPIGALLDKAGIRLVFTSTGASLAAGTMAFPLMVRAVRQALEAVDPRLEEAARGLGAGFWDRLFTITLPLAAPGLIAALVIGFAAALGEFGAVITFAANVPGETQTLPLAIYSALQVPGGERIALRLALISLSLAVAALLLSEWLLRAMRREGRDA
ncbi:molybdate ABC transporter permease subunit [Sphingomonas naphthae]|uniref:Molybdenum transport system permease n=1 Tax=Sphingomonas naphthae TaxID=1813468 RepID=A0ABY7TPC7_9SPHN|nr:molybdate ABC transporter permease subunit [Sphingomonas naphthae]WCT74561.1 molybdate ABC transporter permease subunit [Sphingomonas naphthae]